VLEVDLAGTIQEVIPGFERDLARSGRVLLLDLDGQDGRFRGCAGCHRKATELAISLSGVGQSASRVDGVVKDTRKGHRPVRLLAKTRNPKWVVLIALVFLRNVGLIRLGRNGSLGVLDVEERFANESITDRSGFVKDLLPYRLVEEAIAELARGREEFLCAPGHLLPEFYPEAAIRGS